MANNKINSDYLMNKNGYTQSFPIGSVVIWMSSSIPSGWLLCDGTTYNISDYTELGNFLGSYYGGNGTTTFAVPPLVYNATSNPTQRYPVATISAEPAYPTSFAHDHASIYNANFSTTGNFAQIHKHVSNTNQTSSSTVTLNHNHPSWFAASGGSGTTGHINSISTYNSTINRATSANVTTQFGNDAHTHSAANTNIYMSNNYPNTASSTNIADGNNPSLDAFIHTHATGDYSVHGSDTHTHSHTSVFSTINVGGTSYPGQQTGQTIAYPNSLEVYFIIKC